MSDAKPVSIQLLDREYTVGCVAEERDSLLAAAKMLDAKMREIRGGNRMAALDRVAVLAALNLAHDLEQLREETARREKDLSRSFGELNRKLDGLFNDSSA
ncbi:cell division protein ZapA [Lysobacter sp. H23M47]|uniref:cell division protein ZapA n=1 Tax=Lysobacter sp. H23M47 TaxID=2781024 RepID=UPI0018820C7C|nr:cell division protein ZapA [Lysobacter sp. H23M47]QOW25108.1 cell division protein ZapA [Lysobacter sp. H23M47]